MYTEQMLLKSVLQPAADFYSVSVYACEDGFNRGQ